MVGVGSEREGVVEDDSEVADLGGGGDDGANDVEREGLGWAGEVFWADYEYFWFIAVEFEKILLHPWFYISKTGGESKVGDWGDGLAGEAELGVVSVAVEIETMTTDDLSKGKDVNDKEEGTKHGTLGDTVGDWGGGGFTVIYGNELMSVWEIWGEPGEGSASYTKRVLETWEEDGVVDGVEGGAEVEEDEDGEEARVSREK